MKASVLLLISALLILPCSSDARKKEEIKDIKVISYNIRLGSANDGTNSWLYRCPATFDMILDEKPDIMGVQEALIYQIGLIEENCRDYKSVGVGRDDGKKSGEFMSIIYNKKTVSVLKWGTFWLSETPDKPSKGWDAACFRTATWAVMKDKATGNKFLFVNTHIDHEGVEAQKNGLALVMEKISEINDKGYPVVLTGDFNVTPDNKALIPVDAKMKSARKTAVNTDSIGTYNGWGKHSEIIDYIYYSGFKACPEYRTITTKYSKRTYMSDHYPIVSRLIF